MIGRYRSGRLRFGWPSLLALLVAAAAQLAMPGGLALLAYALIGIVVVKVAVYALTDGGRRAVSIRRTRPR